MAIRVFHVEDHQTLRRAVEMYLSLQADFDYRGSASRADEAIEVLSKGDIDVAIIDLSLPGMNGIELVRHLSTGNNKSLRCLILSGHSEPQFAEEALKAGAAGYILKGKPSEIGTAIRRVFAGETYVSPTLDPGYFGRDGI